VSDEWKYTLDDLGEAETAAYERGRRDENEACAKVAGAHAAPSLDGLYWDGINKAVETVAASIRAAYAIDFPAAPIAPERDPPADIKLSPGEFTRMLLEGTRRQGLHWKTIEDLFEMAMRQGMPE
jgi:hypothetical protein